LAGLTWWRFFCRKYLGLHFFRQIQILTNGQSYTNIHTGQISIILLEKTEQSTQDAPDPLGDVNYPECDPSMWIYAAKPQLGLWLWYPGRVSC